MTTNEKFGFDSTAEERDAVARTAGLVSLVVLAVGLGGFAVGIDWAWVVFPVGYGGVLPLAVSYARSQSGATSRGTDGDPHPPDQGADDPLTTLRERYARGEIDDAEFERRVERLLSSDEGEH